MKQAAKNQVDPFRYSPEDVMRLLSENPERLFALFTEFSSRYLRIGQLGVERNTFINWEKGGLIPYMRGEKGWRKFSFLEAVWIKTLEELRALGLPTDTIRVVKEHLWQEGGDGFYDLMLKGLRHPSLPLPQQSELLQHIEQVGMEELKQGFAALQLSPLMFCVVVSLLRKVSYVLAVNKHQEILLIPLVSATTADAHESVGRLQAELFSTSCTVINLGTILRELALQDEVALSADVLLQVLSPIEQRILEVVKEKQYSEIVIQKDKEGQPSHIRVTRRGIDETVIKKLHAYLKKGDYQNIAFKTMDGQLIQFEETSIIKLNEPTKRGRPRKNV